MIRFAHDFRVAVGWVWSKSLVTVLVVTLMLWAAAVLDNGFAFAEEPQAVLTGDCVPTSDGTPWDCRIEPPFKSAYVACEKPELVGLDPGWLVQGGFTETNEFILSKVKELGLLGFLQWTSCQNLRTEVNVRRDGVLMVGMVIYDPLDTRLKAMTENWPWWCAEQSSFSGMLSEMFGCFVPLTYDVGILFSTNGEFQEIYSGTAFK